MPLASSPSRRGAVVTARTGSRSRLRAHRQRPSIALPPPRDPLRTPATSARDPRVVRAARLLRDAAARRAERAVVLDSPALVRTALELGCRPAWVLGDADGLGLPADVPVAPAQADALRALAALGQPPRVVALCPLPPPPPLALAPRALVLAGVGDAGNVGSIARTAAAFGLPQVWLTDGAADPWSRRALRAAQGASLRAGLVAEAPGLRDLAALPDRPPLAAAVPRGGVDPARLPAGAAVVLGAEGRGLPRATEAACDLAVTVPATGFESLNVAAAAAVLAHELAGERGR